MDSNTYNLSSEKNEKITSKEYSKSTSSNQEFGVYFEYPISSSSPSKIISREEVLEMKRQRRLNAEKLYQNLAKNENLSPEAHTALCEIAKIRHKIHASGEYIFCRTKKGHSMENSLFAALVLLENNADKYPELMPDENIKLSFNKMKDATIEAKHNPSTKEECITKFIAAKEEVNDAITALLAEVDKTYGTQYCPRGTFRQGLDTYEVTTKKINSLDKTISDSIKAKETTSPSPSSFKSSKVDFSKTEKTTHYEEKHKKDKEKGGHPKFEKKGRKKEAYSRSKMKHISYDDMDMDF